MATSSTLIRWGKHYELGNRKLDQQHEELINLLNRLHTVWKEGASHALLAGTLSTLAGAVRAHFRTEERLMARHRYARLASHKAEHDSFAARIAAFQSDFETGRAFLDESLFRYLAGWLRDHLIVSDKPMGEALRQKR